MGHAAVLPSPHSNAPEPFRNPVGLARLAVVPPRTPEHVDPALLQNAPPYPSNVGPVGAVDTLEVPAEPLPPPDPPPPEDPDGEPPPPDDEPPPPDDEPPPPELTGDEELPPPAAPLPEPTEPPPPPPPPPEPPGDPGDVAVTVISAFCPAAPMSTGGGAGSAAAVATSRLLAHSRPASVSALRPPIVRRLFAMGTHPSGWWIMTGHTESLAQTRPWSRAIRCHPLEWDSSG